MFVRCQVWYRKACADPGDNCVLSSWVASSKSETSRPQHFVQKWTYHDTKPSDKNVTNTGLEIKFYIVFGPFWIILNGKQDIIKRIKWQQTSRWFALAFVKAWKEQQNDEQANRAIIVLVKTKREDQNVVLALPPLPPKETGIANNKGRYFIYQRPYKLV